MIRRLTRRALVALLLVGLAFWAYHGSSLHRNARRGPRAWPSTTVRRPYGVRVVVDPATVWVDDGDTIRITWPDAPRETVRLLGIDAPEVRHRRGGLLEGQPHGVEALEFARRLILGARRLELLRAHTLDRYNRTLGYVFVDGANFSALAVENHMAESTLDRYGDNGFPREAAEIRSAARRAGPPPFESPAVFRARERESR